MVLNINANFTDGRQTAPPCPVCRNPFDDYLMLHFNSMCREQGVNIHIAAEQVPTDIHLEPGVGTTPPAAPQLVVPTCCYRTDSTDNRMVWAPYQNHAKTRNDIEWVEEWMCYTCDARISPDEERAKLPAGLLGQPEYTCGVHGETALWINNTTGIRHACCVDYVGDYDVPIILLMCPMIMLPHRSPHLQEIYEESIHHPWRFLKQRREEDVVSITSSPARSRSPMLHAAVLAPVAPLPAEHTVPVPQAAALPADNAVHVVPTLVDGVLQ